MALFGKHHQDADGHHLSRAEKLQERAADMIRESPALADVPYVDQRQHSIAWTLEEGAVDAVFSCTAPQGATCRLEGVAVVTEGTPGAVVDLDSQLTVAVADSGSCWQLRELADAAPALYRGEPTSLRDGTIELVTVDDEDGYPMTAWRYPTGPTGPGAREDSDQQPTAPLEPTPEPVTPIFTLPTYTPPDYTRG